MTTRIEDKELKALANLNRNPDFEIFMEYVERFLAEETKTCIYSDSPDARGRAQVLTELKITIGDARSNVVTRIAKRAVRADSGNSF